MELCSYNDRGKHVRIKHLTQPASNPSARLQLASLIECYHFKSRVSNNNNNNNNYYYYYYYLLFMCLYNSHKTNYRDNKGT
jgi:hypothetical protein